jgi:hypothetical protein
MTGPDSADRATRLSPKSDRYEDRPENQASAIFQMTDGFMANAGAKRLKAADVAKHCRRPVESIRSLFLGIC